MSSDIEWLDANKKVHHYEPDHKKELEDIRKQLAEAIDTLIKQRLYIASIREQLDILKSEVK